MNPDQPTQRRHESIDHEHPTDAGPMAPAGQEVPGTGIMGDETLVRDADGAGVPGIYPGSPGHTGGAAHPGPTPAGAADRIAQGADASDHD